MANLVNIGTASLALIIVMMAARTVASLLDSRALRIFAAQNSWGFDADADAKIYWEFIQYFPHLSKPADRIYKKYGLVEHL